MKAFLHCPSAAGPIGPAVSFIDGLIRWLCALALWLGFFALFIPTLANALLRYATNESLVWSVEVVQLVFPWFIMAGATLAAQHSRHIGVEFLIRALPRRAARWVTIAAQLIICAGAFAVMYVFLGFGRFEGGIAFAAGEVMYTSLNLPQSHSYYAILCGYALIALSALTNVYRQLMGERDPRLSAGAGGEGARRAV